MASSLKNLSYYKDEEIPSAADMSFGIVVSEWNEEITNALLHGALSTLYKHGAVEENIIVVTVPGSFELIYATKTLIENYNLDAVISIGCVISGETPHFDYICQGITQGLAQLNTMHITPVIFGVLTTDNIRQARDRSGGKHGNKGTEAAITAIKMAQFSIEHEHFNDEDSEYDPDELYFN